MAMTAIFFSEYVLFAKVLPPTTAHERIYAFVRELLAVPFVPTEVKFVHTPLQVPSRSILRIL